MLDAMKVSAEVAAWLCIGVVVCGGMVLVARLTVISLLDACRPASDEPQHHVAGAARVK